MYLILGEKTLTEETDHILLELDSLGNLDLRDKFFLDGNSFIDP